MRVVNCRLSRGVDDLGLVSHRLDKRLVRWRGRERERRGWRVS